MFTEYLSIEGNFSTIIHFKSCVLKKMTHSKFLLQVTSAFGVQCSESILNFFDSRRSEWERKRRDGGKSERVESERDEVEARRMKES